MMGVDGRREGEKDKEREREQRKGELRATGIKTRV